ncbi:MAG: ABC transporter transmembrane domain-containing protein, partial [Streptosporangiaceae bacterium]
MSIEAPDCGDVASRAGAGAGCAVDTSVPPDGHRPPGGQARWRTLYGFLRPYRLALLAGSVLSMFTAATGLALPLVVRMLIDDLSSHRSVVPTLLVMTALVVANGLLGAAGSYILRRTAETVILAVRRRLVDRLLGLTVSALDRAEPGDLMARV